MVAAALAAGCATSDRPVHVAGIRSAAEADVTSCAYLDAVAGASGWYGMFARKGLENARLAALDQAQALGATHVVWTVAPQGYGSSHATGRAYRCK